MKILILAFITVLSLSSHSRSQIQGSEIKKYDVLSNEQRKAQGYTETVVKATLKAPYYNWVKFTTEVKLKDWKDFVNNGDEYSHLTKAERAKIAANPLKELKTDSLLEVTEISVIKKKGKIIGYKIEVADHVQAAIYQDGAWFVLYTDSEMNVILEDEHSA
jgi:hypothetical protein